MKTILRTAMMAGGVASLAACGVIHPEAFDKQGIDPMYAKNAVDRGTPFQQSLHKGYANFGEWEYQQADFRDAKYFNDKAKNAAAGQSVAPTDPASRAIDPPHMAEAKAGQSRLLAQLGRSEVLTQAPEPAAMAQVYFDCWVEQLEEGHQPEHIAYCKREFEANLGKLTAIGAQKPAQQPAQAKPTPTAAPSSTPFLLFFDWDSAALTDTTRQTVNQIATTIRTAKPNSVSIAGHADKSGGDSYNDRLSMRRANTVLDALAAQGVARDKATIEAFGESRPLVDTADGVREPQNRRVEVTVR